MNGYTSAAHLDDAALMQLLDRAASPVEHERWDAHVATCTQCARAVDRLRADAAVVRGWLERAAFEADIPPRPAPVSGDVGVIELRRRRPAAPAFPPSLRVAAAILIVALPVAAITMGPLKDWLRDEPVQATPGTSMTAAPPEPQGTVHFAARGNFDVRVDAAQHTGTMTIQQFTGDLASFTFNVHVPTVYSESGLHLRNTAATSTSYILHVPETVTRVTVRIGDRVLRVLDAKDLLAPTEIPLR